MEKRICVFCSSSDKIDKSHFAAAETFARELALSGYTIVCGGGVRGLMGQITHTARQNGGQVIGIMPEFMRRIEWDSKELTKLIVVDTMRERKRQMIENVDAVVALAGGCGTLEEISEVMSLKRLGQFTKPIVILNTNGFYDNLKLFFQKMVDENFMSKQSLDMWTFVDNPSQIIEAIDTAKTFDRDAINFAVV